MKIEILLSKKKTLAEALDMCSKLEIAGLTMQQAERTISNFRSPEN